MSLLSSLCVFSQGKFSQGRWEVFHKEGYTLRAERSRPVAGGAVEARVSKAS